MPSNPVERFLRFIDVRPEGCWLWTGTTAGSKGRYGYFGPGTHSTDPKVPAHRYAYELWIGEIPADLEVDHTCRNRLCVNPGHLEAVTPAENSRRARLDTCKHGHDLTVPGNMRWDSQGRRRGCYVCVKERRKAKYDTNPDYREHVKALVARNRAKRMIRR